MGYFSTISVLLLLSFGMGCSSRPDLPLRVETDRAAGRYRESPENVILVTWDGVRREELLGGADSYLIERGGLRSSPWSGAAPSAIAPFLLGKVAQAQAVFVGDEQLGSEVEVSSRHFISLPSYEVITTGRVQDCSSNGCREIPQESLLDRLQRELVLSFEQLALISSWETLRKAATVHSLDQPPFVVSSGIESFPSRVSDAHHEELNHSQDRNRPDWGDARKDEYTVQHALHYVERFRPRFMMLSLNDTDEWAHRTGGTPSRYQNYLNQIRQYDQWLSDLFTLLDRLGEYGENTTVIVTTDHGRGTRSDFDAHNGGLASAGKIWVWIGGYRAHQAEKRGRVEWKTSHRDLRPTIENWLGVRPVDCADCGRPMPL
jgi:hypothetical protein